MKKIILLVFISGYLFGQQSDASLTTQVNTDIRNKTAPSSITRTNVADALQALIDSKVSILAPRLTTTSTDLYVWTANGTTGLGQWASSTLAGLTDVSLTGLVANDFLKYDGADWINRTPTNVRTDLGLDTWTNLVSTVTGTAPYWSLATASTQTWTANQTYEGSSANRLAFNFPTLAANSGIVINNTATDAASNTQKSLEILNTGANATSTQTTYGVYISNTKTGTSSTNVGVYATATGGTNTRALYTSAGIGTTLYGIYNEGGRVYLNVNPGTPSTSGLLVESTANDIRVVGSFQNINGGGAARSVVSFINNSNTGLSLSYTSTTFSGSILGVTVGANTSLIYNAQNAPLILGTNNLQRFRIEADGNILLGSTGTITANTRLDIRGIGTTTDNIIRLANSANTARLTLTDAGVGTLTGSLDISGGLNLSGASSPLQVGGSAGTLGYKFTSAGPGATPTWEPDGITVGTTTITSGTDGRLGYNNGGVYGEDAGLNYDDTNDALTVGVSRLHTFGTGNTFLGETAGNFTLSGADNNIGIGKNTLNALTNGDQNVAIGQTAGELVAGGIGNTFVGAISGVSTVSSTGNTGLGTATLNLATGSGNTALGYRAGAAITTGTNNISIGDHTVGFSDDLQTGSNNIVIGADIAVTSSSASNTLYIQNIIFGTGNSGTGTTVSTGSIGIGTGAPDRRVHVELESAATNTITYLQRLTSTSSGTPAAGIGSGMEFEVETAAGNNEVGATIEAEVTDVTSTSEDFDLVFKTMAAGAAAAERFRVLPSGIDVTSTVDTGSPISAVRVNRSLTTGSANGHGFKDITVFDRATFAYAAFDATFSMGSGGSNNYNHGAGLQNAILINTSGTVDNLYGVVNVPDMAGGGTLTNSFGLYMANMTGTGSVTNQYGVYVASLTKGTNNWGVYVNGSTSSYFGGNVGIGTSTFGTSAAQVLAIANGTPPSTSPANSVQLYAEDVAASSELKVRDEATNVTTLSPHNFSLIGQPSEPGAWAFYGEYTNKETGEREAVNVDMLKLARWVEILTGDKLVYKATLKK